MTTVKAFADQLDLLTCSDEPVPPEAFVKLANAAEGEARVSSDPELYHLAAVAWYENPAESPARSKKIRELERKAIALDATHQFAQQYLAYICFDERCYEEAIEHLGNLKDSFFESFGQPWRTLKNRELLLVAKFALHRICDESEFSRLLSDYEAFSDLGGPPVPSELARYLAQDETSSVVSIGMRKQFWSLVKKLDYETALSEYLPNK